MDTSQSRNVQESSQPDLEVRVVVFSLHNSRLKVLLTPSTTPEKWQLPGAALQTGQSLEETAAGCLSAFICRHKIFLEQLYTYGDPARSPGERVVSIVYFALVPSNVICAVETAANQADWFAVDALPPLTADFAGIVAYALRRLRYKLEYTAVGFELLPDTFTLSELQHTYEMILGEQLDKRNFRRRILTAAIIEPTTQRRAGEGRPAQLYRYRPDAVAEVKARRLFP